MADKKRLPKMSAAEILAKESPAREIISNAGPSRVPDADAMGTSLDALKSKFAARMEPDATSASANYSVSTGASDLDAIRAAFMGGKSKEDADIVDFDEGDSQPIADASAAPAIESSQIEVHRTRTKRIQDDVEVPPARTEIFDMNAQRSTGFEG